MAATIGTIPALPQYQPAGLPLAGTEAFEIVNTTNATAAASYFLLVTDAVGKAPSVMTAAAPAVNIETLRFWVSQSANATSAQQRIQLATWVALEGSTATPTGSTSVPIDEIAALQVVTVGSGEVLLQRDL